MNSSSAISSSPKVLTLSLVESDDTRLPNSLLLETVGATLVVKGYANPLKNISMAKGGTLAFCTHRNVKAME
jgi:hypothetical protein